MVLGFGSRAFGVCWLETPVQSHECLFANLTDSAAPSVLTLTSRPTVRTEFKAHNDRKTAVYMLRWVNTGGEKGPWSEICSATVAA